MLAVVSLLVLAAVVFGWLQLREHNENRNTAAVASCFDGDRTLAIAADPSIASALAQVADAYNGTHPVVRDQCVTVSVLPQSSDEFIAALGAMPAQDLPSVWVAQSEAELARARAAHPDALSSASRSVATSPVVLAVPEAQASALAEVSWRDVPARQAAGDLGLALPGGADSGATTLALSAVVAGVAGADSAPLTAEQAASPAALEALAVVRQGASAHAFSSTTEALAAVTGANPGVLAVPATEQQLFQAVKDQSSPTVRGISPLGDTPVADYPATTLAGADSDETLSRAASAFNEFARQSDQTSLLAEAGFHTADDAPTPLGNAAVAFTRPQTVLPTPEAGALTAIAPRAGSGHQANTTTILLDVSGSMRATDGGRIRLASVTDALRAEIAAVPGDAAIGLWRYSANLNGAAPYAIDVTTGVLDEPTDGGEPRRRQLDAVLARAQPVSSTHTYPSLEAAYASAVAGYRAGQRNSVLLITDGPNDDPSHMDTGRLLATIAAAQDPNRPVVIDIIVISPNSDLATLQAVADQTGGTLTYLESAVGPQLGAALQASMG